LVIGVHLRVLRRQKQFSQGEIEKRTGLLRSYISRVENGHTVPAVETLEKFARALEVPLYQLFYEGERPADLSNLPKRKAAQKIEWGGSGKERVTLDRFRLFFSRMQEGDRQILLALAQKMAEQQK
jgi:transcriptional regulator with XRE-family HTH domain